MGSSYWGFEDAGVVPDIGKGVRLVNPCIVELPIILTHSDLQYLVTMAKSIGNGYPLAAVVTTPGIVVCIVSFCTKTKRLLILKMIEFLIKSL